MDKDLPPPPPFSSAGFTMYRPGDPFSAPMYSPLSFVRPGLDQRLALMNQQRVRPGAFRPLGPGGVDGGEPSYHSAFSPAKKIKSDNDGASTSSENPGMQHSSMDGSFREDRERSEGREASPGVKEERPSSISSAGYDTISEPLSDSNDRGTPDSEGRTLRKARRPRGPDDLLPCCPVCGLTLRPGELEHHLLMEVERLGKITRGGRKSRDSTPQGRKGLPSPSGSRRGQDTPTPEVASRSRFDNYLRVRCNRQARLSARSRNKRDKKGSRDDIGTVCPVCSERLSGSPEELNTHVELCLKQRSGSGEEEALEVDVEGEYEEYEWAGQTRVRATSMLPGGFAASGFQTHNSRLSKEEEGDLDVDGVDSETYGTPQFGETNIIPVGGGSPEGGSSTMSRTDMVNADGSGSSKHHSPHDNPNNCDKNNEDQSISALVSALRAKLQDLEHEKAEKQKCLICMEAYITPLTSIQCWHVHCEACWMRTLGAKKLCPQCNMITSPSDLRRIYL